MGRLCTAAVRVEDKHVIGIEAGRIKTADGDIDRVRLAGFAMLFVSTP